MQGLLSDRITRTLKLSQLVHHCESCSSFLACTYPLPALCQEVKILLEHKKTCTLNLLTSKCETCKELNMMVDIKSRYYAYRDTKVSGNHAQDGISREQSMMKVFLDILIDPQSATLHPEICLPSADLTQSMRQPLENAVTVPHPTTASVFCCASEAANHGMEKILVGVPRVSLPKRMPKKRATKRSANKHGSCRNFYTCGKCGQPKMRGMHDCPLKNRNYFGQAVLRKPQTRRRSASTKLTESLSSDMNFMTRELRATHLRDEGTSPTTSTDSKTSLFLKSEEKELNRNIFGASESYSTSDNATRKSHRLSRELAARNIDEYATNATIATNSYDSFESDEAANFSDAATFLYPDSDSDSTFSLDEGIFWPPRNLHPSAFV